MNAIKRHGAISSILVLLLVQLVSAVYFFPRWADWSQNSRMDLIMAIVDQGRLQIDDYYQNTGDYAYFDGHYYSDKAPGVAMLGVPPYAAFKLIAGALPVEKMKDQVASNSTFAATLRANGSGLQVDKLYFAIALTFVTCAVVAIPSALLGVVLYCLLCHFTQRELYRVGLVMAYGLATPAFAYSGALFSHQIVAFLLAGAFLLMFVVRHHRVRPWGMLPAGAMVGLAIISEYPAALIGAGLTVYALYAVSDRRWFAGYLLSGVPFGLLLAWHNWIIFRSPLPVSYFYSPLYHEQHYTGFLSLGTPRADALWGITFGDYRGLFFLSPWLLLSLPGLYAFRTRRTFRPELLTIIYIITSFLLFNGSSVMWQGGYAVGPRYLLPMLPFLVLAVVFAWEDWGGRRLMQLGTAASLCWSVFAVWTETIGGQSFPDWTENPLFSYSLPGLLEGNVARNVGMGLGLSGVASVLPLLGLISLLVLWKFLVARRISLRSAVWYLRREVRQEGA